MSACISLHVPYTAFLSGKKKHTARRIKLASAYMSEANLLAPRLGSARTQQLQLSATLVHGNEANKEDLRTARTTCLTQKTSSSATLRPARDLVSATSSAPAALRLHLSNPPPRNAHSWLGCSSQHSYAPVRHWAQGSKAAKTHGDAAGEDIAQVSSLHAQPPLERAQRHSLRTLSSRRDRTAWLHACWEDA
jgi:hypothetical protein